MRILQATGAFLPRIGGGPFFVHYLSTQLEDSGDDCLVVTTGAGEEAYQETVETVRARSIDVAGFPVSPAYPNALQRSIRNFEPDLIHAHYPLPLFPETAAVYSVLFEVPLVLTCHGALEMNWKSGVGAFGSLYNRTLLHLSLSVADRLHVSNQRIPSTFPMFNRYRSKIRTIPMGVDLEWFDPESVSGKPPNVTDDDVATVLFVGAFRRYKGLETLIDAFDTLRGKMDCRLVLVGDGPRRRHIESMVRSRGLANDVLFTGYIDREALRATYATADVFVLPSPTMSESFGLVALEAMAMRVPVVLTRGSGVGYLLGDRPSATVVTPDDPDALVAGLKPLINDPETRRSKGRACRKLVENAFSWRALVHEYRALYREIV